MASETITQADRDLFISLRGFGADSDLARQVNAGWYCGDQVAEIAAHRRAAVAELVEALEEADAAIKEWFRYLHGGEMRGSYDGKPEREMLRKAGYRASAALSRHQAGLGKGDDRG